MASADQNLGFLTRRDKLPGSTRFENKTPAPIQIRAEEILHEAYEQGRSHFKDWDGINRPSRVKNFSGYAPAYEVERRLPKQKITEPGDYRLRSREEFEDLIGGGVGCDKSVWVEYAKWEESRRDFTRARSVWELALEADDRDHTLWLKYADFEIQNKFVGRARNVLVRAILLLPRVDRLWYKYIHMEEMLGNVVGARQIFERWMEWMPDQQGWMSYIKFELRYNEVDRARSIYKYALDHIPEGRAENLYNKFVAFEEKYGDGEGIEDANAGKSRFQ